MKNFVKTSLTLLCVLFSVFSFASVNNADLSSILKSDKFLTLSKTFGITQANIDFATIDQTKINETSSMYRLTINKIDRKDFVTVIKRSDNTLMFIYEKTNLDKNENGYFEQYDEKGNFLVDYKVNKLENGKYLVKINDFIVSKRLGLDSTSKLDVVVESWVQCVRRNKETIEKACDANDACSLLCDVSPNCEAYMAAVAAARCTVDR